MRRRNRPDPKLNQVIFGIEEQVILLALARKLDPEAYDDPKVKAVIYKAKGLNENDEIFWSNV